MITMKIYKNQLESDDNLPVNKMIEIPINRCWAYPQILSTSFFGWMSV